jgi:hypothetical protein
MYMYIPSTAFAARMGFHSSRARHHSVRLRRPQEAADKGARVLHQSQREAAARGRRSRARSTCARSRGQVEGRVWRGRPDRGAKLWGMLLTANRGRLDNQARGGFRDSGRQSTLLFGFWPSKSSLTRSDERQMRPRISLPVKGKRGNNERVEIGMPCRMF